jgi:antitoxin Phd
MLVDTNVMVPMTDANQNFSRVARIVDERGSAVILKNNKPRYVVVDFEEYDEIQAAREVRMQKVGNVADELIAENREAFGELAK